MQDVPVSGWVKEAVTKQKKREEDVQQIVALSTGKKFLGTRHYPNVSAYELTCTTQRP
jgi:hypothetical protein